MRIAASIITLFYLISSSELLAQNKVARAADSPVLIPSSASHSFEHAPPPPNGSIRLGGQVSGGWAFAGSAGLADAGSAFGAPTGGDGTPTFAFVQRGGSSISTTIALPAGYWRVRYHVTRRRFQGAGSNNDFRLRVTALHAGVQTTIDEIDTGGWGDAFEARTTGAFVVPTGGATNPTTLTFANIFPFITGSAGDKSNVLDAVTIERLPMTILGWDETAPFDGDFEQAFPNTNTQFLQHNVSGWLGPWQFTGSGGICKQFVAFLQGMQHTPVGGAPALPAGSAAAGEKAAFLQGPGARLTFQGTKAVPAGTYRLRFFAGIRQFPTNQDQAITVDVMGQRLFTSRLHQEASGTTDQEIEIAENTLGMDTLDLGQFREWTTRPFTMSGSTPLTVVFRTRPGIIEDRSVLLDNVRIERLSSWGDALTWRAGFESAFDPAAVPGPQDDVTVPSNVVVAMDAPLMESKRLTVRGELHAPNVAFQLMSAEVWIQQPGAKLGIGRVGAPYTATGEVFLALRMESGGVIPRRLMVSDGGKLEMHGGYVDTALNRPAQHVSWTRLVADVPVNATSVTIEGHHQWPVGAKVLLVSSRGANLPAQYLDETEVHQIASISFSTTGNPTTTLTFTGSVLYAREGDFKTTYQTPSGAVLPFDQRAEVGLLSRNLVVHSHVEDGPDASTQPLSRIGGDIMVMHGPCCTGGSGGGAAQLSGIELTRLGVTQVLGRYPLHWHMLVGEGHGQFLRASSVHHTFNRAVTIHGTDSVLVKENVIFENLGHAVFLEDGSEEDNVIKRNLVVRTVRPTIQQAVLGPNQNPLTGDYLFTSEPQNRSPASFWITNPKNYLIDNVAAASNGTAYWFLFSAHVIGPSKITPGLMHRIPQTRPFGAFRGNSAHSVMLAFDIGDGLHKHGNPVPPGSSIGEGDVVTNIRYLPPSRQVLGPFTVWGSETGIYGSEIIDAVEFVDSVFVENRRAIDLARGDTRVRRCVVVASTNNPVTRAPGVPSGSSDYNAFTIYDGPAFLQDVAFREFSTSVWPRRSLIFMRGAHELRTNSTFSQIGYGPAPLPVSQPLLFPDHSNPTYSTPGHAHNPANPRIWGGAVLSVDAARTLMPATVSHPAYRTVCSNHPWMLRGSQGPNGLPEVLWQNPQGAPASNAIITDAVFGYFNLRHMGVTNVNQPTARFTRVRSGYPPAAFDYHFTVDDHWAFPAIANEDVEYDIEWKSAPLPQGYQNYVRFFISDVPVDQPVFAAANFVTTLRFVAPTGPAIFRSLSKVTLGGTPLVMFPALSNGEVDRAGVKQAPGSAFSISASGKEMLLKIRHTTSRIEEFDAQFH
jgi:hypothetical protein